MAWNEPGGRNSKQDPWRGGGHQGPPDLDEFIKKLQEKMPKFFGGGGTNSTGGGYGFLVAVLILLILGWGAYGVYRVEQAEQAVILRFGKFHNIVGAGLHWNPPLIDEVLKVNTEQVSSQSHQSSMLTEDQNIVDVQLEVQYRVQNPRDYFLSINDPKSALKQATESALRHVVGGSEMDEVITEGRYVLAQDVISRLQNYLDRHKTGLIATKVNVEDAHPPNEVKAAFDDVIKAKEDEVRLKNEAEAYANGVIPEARGQAQRLLEEANAYKNELISRASGDAERFTKLRIEYEKAPKVTRERLYLETMEQVLGRVTKVVMDVEGGQSLTYLPLDKLLNLGARSAHGDQSTALDVTAPLDNIDDHIRTRRSNLVRREGR